MTEKEVRDAVRAWIAGLMGITVIQSYQGQKEPSEPYGVLNLMLADSVRELPAAMEITSAGTGEDEVFTQSTAHEWFWRFSVNVYGGEGKTCCAKSRRRSSSPAREAVSARCLSLKPVPYAMRLNS